ncbi:MAG: sigma-70 family RNA polymerase sigma factor [Planctomycetota bacterium]
MEDPDLETTKLLERWCAGDSEALEALLNRHLGWVREQVERRIGGGLRRKTDTDDVVQEVVVRVLKYGPRFVVGSTGQFRSLLGRIVENVLRDQHDLFNAACRAADREESLPGDSVLLLRMSGDPVTTPSQVACRRERIDWLRLGMELLDFEERQVLGLRHWLGLSYAEIAERIGVQEDAARMRFNRALVHLARKLRDLRGGDVDDLVSDVRKG